MDDTEISGTQRVEVSGRVVDPSEGEGYQAVLDYYSDQFGKAPIEKARIIQVGMQPGDGRQGWYLVGVFLSLLFALNIYTLISLIRVKRSALVINANSSPS